MNTVLRVRVCYLLFACLLTALSLARADFPTNAVVNNELYGLSWTGGPTTDFVVSWQFDSTFSAFVEGTADGRYCYWNRGENKWSLSRYNSSNPPFNHAARVCDEVE